MFYSELNKPPITPTPSGTKQIDKYELKIVDNRKQIKKAGKRDIYTLKQECLEETKIYNILKRHAMGDETALYARQGMFFDATQMPSSLLEAENAILRAQKEFDRLDIEERKKYNQNWREWINDIMKPQPVKQDTQKSYVDTITPSNNQSITQTTTTPTTGGNE